MHHAYIDRFAAGDSPVHRIDPRAKVLVVLVFTALVVSVPKYEVAALFPYAVLPFAMLAFGGIPFRFVAKHLLIVSPFVVFVAIFNPLYDTRSVLVHVGERAFWVRGGLLSCANICGKFVLTVGALIAVVSTTRFSDLLHALAWFRLPRLFIMELSFLYRYLFLLVEQAMHMRRARDSRGVGAGRLRWRLKTTGGIIGSLFVRTLERGERIYAAMASRGFDGAVRTLHHLHMHPSDYAFLIGGLAFVAALRFGGYLVQ